MKESIEATLEAEQKASRYFETLTLEALSADALIAIDGLRGVLSAQRDAIDSLEQKLARADQLAATDSLTRLKNRRAFDEDLKRYSRLLNEGGERRSSDYQHHALLIIGDLDNFKLINDVLGYEYGDRMLVVTARVLEASFRQSDSVYRLGGDEFAGLASVRPGSEASTYDVIMERFYDTLEDLRANTPTTLSHKLNLSALDREALRALDASFSYSILETGFSEEDITRVSNMTMRNVKHTKDEKQSVR